MDRFFKTAEPLSYGMVREIYRTMKSEHIKRQQSNTIWKGFWDDFITKRQSILKLLKGGRNVLFFTLIEMVRVITFCFVYLAEIQNTPTRESWFQIDRSNGSFATLILLSYLTLISIAIRLILADNATQTIRSPLLWMNFTIACAFIVLNALPNNYGHNIYVPYFLTALEFIPTLKIILLSRSRWQFLNMSALREKMVILVANVVLVIYMGVCLFDYFETNFNYILDKPSLANSTILDKAYFLVITMSTVGYGDITPRSTGGKLCVIAIIMYSLVVFPGLIADMQETFNQQKSGSGAYIRGSSPYFVICGDFHSDSRIRDAIDLIYHHDPKKKSQIVLLSRHKITPAMKLMLNEIRFRNRVFFLQGKGLDVEDMRRVDLKFATAAFILANSAVVSAVQEDQQNTLRAWAFDDFSPNTPLYVETLLPQSSVILERTTTGCVCLDELKQLFLAYNCLYRGVGTLIINLLQNVPVFTSFHDPWHAQYGDGAANEFYESTMNPVFIGQSFTQVAFFLFKEYQIVLCGVNSYHRDSRKRLVRLNPGPTYVLQKDDTCFIIAPSQKDMMQANKTTHEHFSQFFPKREQYFRMESLLRPRSSEDLQELDQHYTEYLVAFPEHVNTYGASPLCLVLPKPLLSVDEMLVENGLFLKNHILVCTGDFNLFHFICTLRSAHLSQMEFKSILILCPHEPTMDEFRLLAQFPLIYIMVGDAQNRNVLEQAGIQVADKVVVVNMHNKSNQNLNEQDAHDGFADSPSIMIAHAVYDMFHRSGIRKTTIIDLEKRSNVKFLRPSSRKMTRGKKKEGPDFEADIVHNAYYTPMYGAGRVLTTSMLEKVLYKLYFQPSILSVFRSICGLHVKVLSLNIG
ncbi:hypothetical protein EDD86DRAFT_150601 [Gorgonomyces haynaldii]|nr:hypothetical protein EDD86DRAFT_150601 [Gorgonomyces haynaldii]